jgi:hypothetical protein
LALILALLSPATYAEPGQSAEARHTSALGFSVILPAAWVPLDPVTSPTDLDELKRDGRFSELDPDVFASALQKVQSGEFEFFFRQPFEGFAQNIAVRERNLNIPRDADALSKECKALPSTLRHTYDRDISPPTCQLRSVAGRPASYIEIEGPVPETLNLQYQVQRTEGRVLAITATVLSASLPSIRDEFESIVRSMRITSSAP